MSSTATMRDVQQSIQVAEITTSPLNVHALTAAVSSPQFGAVATFVGQVRDHDPDVTDRVTHLSYSAHPDAAAFLRQAVERVVQATLVDSVDSCTEGPVGQVIPLQVAVQHRVGDLMVGEAALVVCVASAHRKLAFAVCPAVVDEIKKTVPLWKKQHTASGQAVWSAVACQH